MKKSNKKRKPLSKQYIQKLIAPIPKEAHREMVMDDLKRGKARTERDRVMRKTILNICRLYSLQRKADRIGHLSSARE
jgi:hypothetical protein